MDPYWIEDPGHAWLVVERAEVRRLGIADKISVYSYSAGGYAYLEEDCDAGVYIEAAGLQTAARTFSTIYVDDNDARNPRHYARYAA